MGRLSKGTATRPIFKIHYRKLVNEYSASDNLRIMPSIPEYLSYCCHHCGHTQKLQAEELNSIVGNAFRMAYAAQLQKQPSFQDVISSQLDQPQDKVLWNKELSPALKKEKSSRQTIEMEDVASLRVPPPTTIPGLKPTHKYNVLGPTEKTQSQQSTPDSEESNSPTEMNSYKKMTEKPPLIKRLALGLTGNHDSEEDSCPLVSDNNTSTPNSPINRPLSGGYVNETINNQDGENRNIKKNVVQNIKNELHDNFKHKEIENNRLLMSSPIPSEDFKTKRISSISSSSSTSNQQATDNGTLVNFIPVPPPLPERTDSLNNKEEGELRLAPWFQAGIPREIALEILNQEPVGAFMVRESTSKPGCFALSLRVPRSFQPTGIAHYLIIRTTKGYKIKGFTKEFLTLTSLITHHSVMPELLPCPLSLSRYNPSFAKSDSKRDFADIDLDPDYNTLADFRKMMADLNV